LSQSACSFGSQEGCLQAKLAFHQAFLAGCTCSHHLENTMACRWLRSLLVCARADATVEIECLALPRSHPFASLNRVTLHLHYVATKMDCYFRSRIHILRVCSDVASNALIICMYINVNNNIYLARDWFDQFHGAPIP
jgi:hypothetical protein